MDIVDGVIMVGLPYHGGELRIRITIIQERRVMSYVDHLITSANGIVDGKIEFHL